MLTAGLPAPLNRLRIEKMCGIHISKSIHIHQTIGIVIFIEPVHVVQVKMGR